MAILPALLSRWTWNYNTSYRPFGAEEPESEIDVADEQIEDEKPQSELPPRIASGLPYLLPPRDISGML